MLALGDEDLHAQSGAEAGDVLACVVGACQ